MKKFLTVCAVGLTLAVAGCASKGAEVDYSQESAAPYSESRTAGGETAVTTTRADRTFKASQNK